LTPITVPFQTVARLAAPSDNVAIAIARIEAGTVVPMEGQTLTCPHTVLEGHRFAVKSMAAGDLLLSWALPFGRATRAIAPGDYVSNPSMLEAMMVRDHQLSLPSKANFEDRIAPFQLDEVTFVPAPPVELFERPRTFDGFRRAGGRGVGTRNFVVILGTTSRTASVARELAKRFQPLVRLYPGIDGVVAIAHTEGGGPEVPNNVREVLRALSGFMVHPNVGAILALDYGVEPIDNRLLESFMRSEGYELNHVLHRFHTLSGSLAVEMAKAEAWVRSCLSTVAAFRRTPEPISGLRVALQCGGSDAFSGVSGNPLAGSVVHEVIRHGGSASLCETDELVGAESYMLRKVRDLPTARALLEKIAAFTERLSWHDLTPEANPSAGNKLRGLYNIVLKSLGAAHKKDPRTRVDWVIDYGVRMKAPGFFFMDSPGNDLEGIAGQVASGCNLFLFVTGNGSITNFPFVPTLKVTTTTRRHELLIHEMDVNAGRYLDGESMESLTAETFELVLATASGRRTQGEHAGHSQVSLWRNWRQTDRSQLPRLRARRTPDGIPALGAVAARDSIRKHGLAEATATFSVVPLGEERWATERIGLVLPTSLCATQIARLAAERLTTHGVGRDRGISRYVALIHTEGCGFGGDSMYKLLLRTYRGYATHPNVAVALLLEHGCEKVPNDVMKRQFEKAGVPLDRFGWASVQLDGGIDKSLQKIETWFEGRTPTLPESATETAGFEALSIGIQTVSGLLETTRQSLVTFILNAIAAGGTVLIADSDPLLLERGGLRTVLPLEDVPSSLDYGQMAQEPGLHLVSTETTEWSENLAGLGACGAHLVVSAIAIHPREGHPLIPVLQFGEGARTGTLSRENTDGTLTGDAAPDLALIVDRMDRLFRGEYTPASRALGMTHFQLTRGLLGIST